jgi:excisionase family DNA binding protein
VRSRHTRAKATPALQPPGGPKGEPREKIYTPEQFAEQWRVSRRTVMKYLQTGRLRGFKVGRFWRIRERDLNAFLRQSTPA